MLEHSFYQAPNHNPDPATTQPRPRPSLSRSAQGLNVTQATYLHFFAYLEDEGLVPARAVPAPYHHGWLRHACVLFSLAAVPHALSQWT